MSALQRLVVRMSELEIKLFQDPASDRFVKCTYQIQYAVHDAIEAVRQSRDPRWREASDEEIAEELLRRIEQREGQP